MRLGPVWSCGLCISQEGEGQHCHASERLLETEEDLQRRVLTQSGTEADGPQPRRGWQAGRCTAVGCRLPRPFGVGVPHHWQLHV